jgi:hypothetical protein
MQKILKNPKMSFNRQPNMFYWQDYFLHMWPTTKVRHFEPIEHNCFAKWFFKKVFVIKKKRLRNFSMFWFFIKITQWNTYFHKKEHVFFYKKFKINCMTLCIPFYYIYKKTLDIISLKDSKWHLRNIQFIYLLTY